jgi:transketolase
MDAVQAANSGHPGAPMGMADIAEVLWRDYLKHNPANPRWADRDRFVLSNGHASMLLYSLLHLTGYADFPIEQLKNFRQLGYRTAGHPEFEPDGPIETTTGPLGQGITNAVGMAMAEKMMAAEFNRPGHEIVDHKTWVFLGDGCLMEGISHEACSLAGTLKLGKLICLYDDNDISIDGNVSGWFTDDTAKRFDAYGWHVIDGVDGHDPAAIAAAIEAAVAETERPSLICCKTVIGFGAPNKQGSESTHGAPLGDDEVEAADMATRKASLRALNAFAPFLPEMAGGSADLTGSNLTKHAGSTPISGSDASGNYIWFGVREFGMTAICNGMRLHGGLIPYSGTFLTFSDYSRNALRMAALMRVQNIQVFTHDSIGLGEDGPTHQPVEQTASLRLMPNMSVWRPCDTVETAVAWRHALENDTGPTSLVLTRQGVPHQSRSDEQVAAISRGGYVLKDCEGTPDLLLIATGSEVALAVGAADALAGEGVKARVVSMPSTDVFDAQDDGYRESVLPSNVTARVAVEAGVTECWWRYTGPRGRVIGVDRFGESAPAGELFEHFGITVDHVLAAARNVLGS